MLVIARPPPTFCSAIQTKLSAAWNDFCGRIPDFNGLWDKERARWNEWAVKKRKQDRDMVSSFLSSRRNTLAGIRRQQKDEFTVSGHVLCARRRGVVVCVGEGRVQQCACQ
jgi:hypothetical protein